MAGASLRDLGRRIRARADAYKQPFEEEAKREGLTTNLRFISSSSYPIYTALTEVADQIDAMIDEGRE